MRNRYMVKSDVLPAKGSVKDIADSTGRTLADVFGGVSHIVLIDQSGSMADDDTRDGRTRYEVAEAELRKIQELYPGQVAVVEFSDDAVFCPTGIPSRSGASTNMLAALQWVKNAGADGLFEIVLISDGEPTSRTPGDAEDEVMRFARTLKGGIHTIYIGAEGSDGERFLRKLAKATGGQPFEAKKPGELGPGILALLGAG